ncbi:MAG: HYR domain-containing protein [Candidatus Zixiibacteriota bacterium]
MGIKPRHLLLCTFLIAQFLPTSGANSERGSDLALSPPKAAAHALAALPHGSGRSKTATPAVPLPGKLLPDPSPRLTPGSATDYCAGEWQGPTTFYVSGWLTGQETYAVFQDPDTTYAHSFGICGPVTRYPFDVAAVTWEVFVDIAPDSMTVVPVIYEADMADILCPRPGNVLCAGATQTVQFPSPGVYVLTLPLPGACCVDSPYFAGVLLPYLTSGVDVITDGGADYGPIPAISCRTFNNWGDGWYDLVGDVSFSTNLRLYSEGYTPDDPGWRCSGANDPPVALCRDLTLIADAACTALGSIDNGSYDPNGDPLTFVQEPPGPYPPGITNVTLIVSDDGGLADSCTATVTVIDNIAPVVSCPPDTTVPSSPGLSGAYVSFPRPTVSENCGGSCVDIVFVIDASGSMGDDQAAIAANAGSFFVGLGGVDARLGVLAFTDVANPLSTSGAYKPGGPGTGEFTKERGSFQTMVTAVGHFGSSTENGLTALQSALAWYPYRADCRRALVLVTDEDADDIDQFSILFPALVSSGAAIHTVISFSDSAGYSALSDSTGGTQLDFTTAWGSILAELAGQIRIEATCVPPSGSYFPIGTSIVRCEAFDVAGNLGDCTFQVTVVDTTAPPPCPPTCVVRDTAFFLCAPAQVRVPVQAFDCKGAPAACAIVSGPGALIGNEWVYTPPGGDTRVDVSVRCTDSAGLFCESPFRVWFTFNRPPTCHVPNDTTIVLCAPGTVCLPVTGTDPDGEPVTCVLVGSKGALANGQWCYSVTRSESVSVTVRCRDACGALCVETFTVTFMVNQPPICPALPDTSYVLPRDTLICRSFAATDPESRKVICTVAPGGPGTVTKNAWCYDVHGNEQFCVPLVCTDPCGATCVDTFCVDITVAGPPRCERGDTTIVLCAAEEVRVPVLGYDYMGGLIPCTLVAGPGSLDGNVWVYTPTGSGTVVVTTACTDTLGRSCEKTFNVTFDINRPPSCAPPNDTTIDLCAPERVCLPFAASDPDGNLVGCELLAGPGEISGGQWCYTPSVSQTANVSVRCRDLCDAECVSTFNVIFRVNQPPTCAAPPDTAVVLPAPTTICRTFQASDADGDPVGCVIRSGPGSLVGNQWCGLMTDTGQVCVQLQCTDPCGNTCIDTFCVDVAFNVAPACALTSPDTVAVESGADVAFTVTVTDPDVGDVVTLSSSSLPAAAGMNPPLPRSGPAHDVTSTFSWTPDPGQVGVHRITFAVSDDHGASGTCTIVIVVLPPDPPQVASAQPSPPARDAFWDRTAVFCFSEPVIVGPDAVSARSNRRGPLTGITVRYDDPSACLTVSPPPSGWPPDDDITIVLAATITDRAGHCLDGNGDGLCENGVPGDDYALTFTTALGVWPGDANGDSIVNEADILSIARFWGLSGPSRGWESGEWEFLPALGWEPREAARADCNSDTRVDADDICPVAEFFDSGAVAILATPKLMRLTGLNPDLREALARALQQCDRISEGTRAGLMRLLGENEHLVEPTPTGFHLAQNYPNPFNSGTVLRFSLPAAARVRLDVCDILGRVVTTIVNDYRGAGLHMLWWDATDARGRALASGIYFLRITTAEHSASRRLVIVR